uniref:Putative terminase n=1 Tax=viral metagenome TaxID=1070528 RepID=A0A6H1ZC03_9ZZZZ
MTKSNITKEDIELFKSFRASPLVFVEKMWGLKPQPIKPDQFVEVNKMVDAGKWNEIKAEHFEPFIKGKHITWQQWMILKAVELARAGKAKSKISIVSGHGTGKSCSIAWLLLWFLFCFKDAQIPCTAPTSSQMHDILWKEVAIWLPRMPKGIADKYSWTTEYVRIKESPETWFARARTASKENSEALAGVHADHVMVLVDEASGVYDEIFNTAEGSMTGENVLVILISNGTRLVGYFYDTHHADAHNWQNMSLDADKSPIVVRKYVDRIIERHGRDSDEYSIRVAGGFGREEGVDDQGYVPLLVEADLREAGTKELKGRVKLGIDPAGDGGDMAAEVARDPYIAKLTALEKTSTPKTIANSAVETIRAYEIAGSDVAVDNFGIGANVTQEIALSAKPGEDPIRAQGVNVGYSAHDDERFFNLRAELAWRMREWIKAGGEIVDLDKWREELLSLRYRRTAGKISKIQLMDKRTMKKLTLNHGKSPNKADALMLTFYTPDTTAAPYKQPEWESLSEYEG